MEQHYNTSLTDDELCFIEMNVMSGLEATYENARRAIANAAVERYIQEKQDIAASLDECFAKRMQEYGKERG